MSTMRCASAVLAAFVITMIFVNIVVFTFVVTLELMLVSAVGVSILRGIYILVFVRPIGTAQHRLGGVRDVDKSGTRDLPCFIRLLPLLLLLGFPRLLLLLLLLLTQL